MRIPAELIGHALDFVSLRDIIVVGHVCSYWHAIARNHPIFWRDIILDTASAAALKLFRARLQQRTDCAVSVTIWMPYEDTFDAFISCVLPLMVEHLHRIRLLHIAAHATAQSQIYLRLCERAAPVLCIFRLHFFRGPRRDPLPVDLFARAAPELREVSLHGFDLTRVERCPPALSAVEAVALVFGNGEVHRALQLDCLATWPAVKRVYVQNGCLVYGGPPSDRTAAVMQRLEALNLWVTQTPSELLAWGPTARIPTIELTEREHPAMLEALAHLRGDWQLNVLPAAGKPDLFLLNYSTAEAPDIRRILVDYVPFYAPSNTRISPAFTSYNLVMPVVQLTLHASLWTMLAPHMAPFPTCKTLIIEIDDKLPLCAATYEDIFPTVSTLRLVNPQPHIVRLCADAFNTLTRTFFPASRHLTCTLHGIEVIERSNDLPESRQDFDCGNQTHSP